MDTKWKNFPKQKKKRVLGTGSRIVLASVLGFLAVTLLIHVMGTGYVTSVVWTIGLVIIACSVGAVLLIFPWALRRKYQDWLPIDEMFYGEWKENIKQQQKKMAIVFGILLLFAYWLFSIQAGYRYDYPFYSNVSYNLAARYLLFAAVIVNFLVCEIVLIRLMYEKLQMYMDKMHQIHEDKMQQALEQAMEIERSSMEKVSRSDQLRMDLITNVSHDLKTPLTSMVGYLELLKKEDLNDTARDYVEVISRRAGKLKEMIESLFSLAKVSSGNVEMKKEHITMNRLLEQIFADMDDRIRQSGLEFVKLFTEEDTGVIADNGYMYRICQNLLENALKYSAQGTRVFVKTCITKQGKIGVEITNTAGYRMNFEKEDIVERFARADAARTSEGNGLGLAIVSTYAKALGGEFDIFIDCDQFKARLLFERAEDEAEGVA